MTARNYLVRWKEFSPRWFEEASQDLDDGFEFLEPIRFREEGPGDEMVLVQQGEKTVKASGPFPAVVAVLDRMLEGFREALRAIDAPRFMIEAQERPHLIERIEPLDDGRWRFYFCCPCDMLGHIDLECAEVSDA